MRKEIGFDSRGKKLVGYLYPLRAVWLPDRQPADARVPTVVVIGPANGARVAVGFA